MARQKIGSLRDARLKKSTLIRYWAACYNFHRYLALFRLPPAADWDTLDRQAAAYIELRCRYTFCSQPPNHGFALKHTYKLDPATSEQEEFFKWAWESGERDKANKLSARTTANYMRLHGTQAGYYKVKGGDEITLSFVFWWGLGGGHSTTPPTPPGSCPPSLFLFCLFYLLLCISIPRPPPRWHRWWVVHPSTPTT